MRSIFLLVCFPILLYFLFFFTTNKAYCQPKTIFNIQFVAEKYQYLQIDVDDDKVYFYSAPGRTYTYKVIGNPAEDTEWNRKEIILALHQGLINRNYALDIKNMVEMKRHGWCIPTIHVAKQEKGLPAMAIDFIVEEGNIAGFLVTSGLPCDQGF